MDPGNAAVSARQGAAGPNQRLGGTAVTHMHALGDSLFAGRERNGNASSRSMNARVDAFCAHVEKLLPEMQAGLRKVHGAHAVPAELPRSTPAPTTSAAPQVPEGGSEEMCACTYTPPFLH